MKKFLYIWLLFNFINVTIMAQVQGDNNWNTTPLFMDDFTTTSRSWNTDFFDIPQYKWRALSTEAGVTHGHSEHQVYQRQNCVFNYANESILLVADYVGGPLQCNDYEIPPGYSCDQTHQTLYFFQAK